MKVSFAPRPSAPVEPAAPAASPTPSGIDPDQAAADAALRDAFSDKPEVDPQASPPPRETPPPEPTPPPVEKEEIVTEEKKPDPVVESTVDELDKPPEGTVIPKLTSKDLRSQLEKANASLKTFEGEKKLQEEELTNLRKELEELKTKSPTAEVAEKADYTNDPAVTKYSSLIQEDVISTGRVIGGEQGKKLNLNFYDKDHGYFPQFLKALAAGDSDEKLDALRTRLDDELGEQGGRDAMALLNRSLPNYRLALAELDKLNADSHNRRGRQTVEKYSAVEKELKGVLEPLGELPEEAIIAKPFAVESFVSKLIESDPKWRVRSSQVKKEILEIFAGVKPLTPEERAKLEANDTGGLSQLEETRTKQYTEKRAAMMKRLYHGWMLSVVAPGLLEELEGLRAGKTEEDSELDALAGVPPAAPPPKSNGAVKERDLKSDLKSVFAGRDLEEV